jgi:hypothetical protein
MKYTQTTTQPLNFVPLGKSTPTFKQLNIGVGKTAPFFVTSTLKGKKLCFYEQEIIPSNVDDDKRIETEDIIDPTPLDIDGDDYPSHIHYEDCKSKKRKPKLHCSGDDDYIEVPGGSDTVPYTDDEGNQYEIPLDDLIEYDGEDGEIQYTKSKGKNAPLVAMHHIKDKPNYYLNMIMAQQMTQRVYSQA